MPGSTATEVRPLQNGLRFPPNRFYTRQPFTFYNYNNSSRNAAALQQQQQQQHHNIGRDELDNNTHNDLLQIGNLKPHFSMSDIFSREEERLKTFEQWPLAWLDKHELAMSGMFYMGDGDKTKCYFCEVEIGRWEREDQPVPEHMRWSPNCPLLRRRTTNNVPINVEALDRLLPAPSYDICGPNEPIEVRMNSYAEGTIPAERLMSADVAPNSPAMPHSSCGGGSPGQYYPEFPEYAIETARLRSFAEWPRHMKQKPQQLAEAGFFYTGVGDRVKCFSCGGGLKDWDENDEPWEQHALWMSKCRYVKLMKGETFTEAVSHKFKTLEADKQQQAAVGNASVVAAAVSVESVSSEEGEQLAVGLQAAIKSNAQQQENVSEQASRIHNIATQNETKLQPTAQRKTSISNSSSNTIPEEKLCKICFAEEYNTAFLPCGHVVACAKCASSVTKCPLCRKPFADVMRVYFS